MAGQLLDQWGRPVRRAELTRDVAGPTIGGVRSPITGYPGDGLTPVRLSSILREADQGEPIRYLELAETIEERDAHYIGVLGTRRRAVSQLDITVEEGGTRPVDRDMAERVRQWLKRDELTEELFDILDAVGKGYSLTEIIWDASSGQWQPERLEWRDPRWFRFDQADLRTPMMLDEGGRTVPLPAFKFIFARIRAKSGIPLRSGLARVAAWTYMFKKFTERDWAIFTQTYGQPLRIGKYGAGASEEDRQTLFRAVANIAGDCAAVVPESMMIDFVETGNLGSSLDLYERRCDWSDKQVSKAVLGQTATTDAVTGGLGSGKEHREVQEDIERADARATAAFLNRDLIQPWMQLEFGPQPSYPRLVIARPEDEDLANFSSALAPLLGHGLRVKAGEVRAKFGLSDPGKKDEILGAGAEIGAQSPTSPEAGDEKGRESAVKYPFNTREQNFRGDPALQAESPSAGHSAARTPEDDLADRLAEEADPVVADMLAQIEAMMNAADTLEEFREMLLSGYGEISSDKLARIMADAMLAAHAGGRAMVEAEAAGEDDG